MDLGFGKSNPTVGRATANALLRTAQAQEAVLQDEIQRYDALLDDDEALEQLRARRLEQMKKAALEKQKYKSLGHGEYKELSYDNNSSDVAKHFFEASKQSSRLVVHFYKPSSAHVCDVFHRHLEILAAKHVETRFVKVNVEHVMEESGQSTSSGVAFLVDRLHVTVMPTLVLIKERQTVHQIRGFDELGGTDSFSTLALAYVLGQHGLIHPTDEEQEPPEDLVKASSILSRGGGGGNTSAIRFVKGKQKDRNNMYGEEEDF